MIYHHAIDSAARSYPDRPAVLIGGGWLTFRELHDRVMNMAATLTGFGFRAGDRLALLLPNSSEYLEFVYACSRIGVIAVPINTRLSVVEIDRVLTDASPRGLVRHSSLPTPTVRSPWELTIDHEPLSRTTDAPPAARDDPDAIL